MTSQFLAIYQFLFLAISSGNISISGKILQNSCLTKSYCSFLSVYNGKNLRKITASKALNFIQFSNPGKILDAFCSNFRLVHGCLLTHYLQQSQNYYLCSYQNKKHTSEMELLKHSTILCASDRVQYSSSIRFFEFSKIR